MDRSCSGSSLDWNLGALHVPDDQASELQSSVLSLHWFGLAVGHHGCQPDQLVGIHDRCRLGRGGLGVFQRPVSPGRISESQTQSVMRPDILGVDGQGAVIGGDCLLEPFLALLTLDGQGPRHRVERRGHLVDDKKIEAEVEFPLGNSGFQDRLETRDRLFQLIVGGVDLTGQPVDHPGAAGSLCAAAFSRAESALGIRPSR